MGKSLISIDTIVPSKLTFSDVFVLCLTFSNDAFCSGFSVISVNAGNIKFVLYLTAEEMMEGKLNILAPIVMLKR